MPLTWDREYDFKGASLPVFVIPQALTGPKDDDDFDTSYTYVESEDDDEETSFYPMIDEEEEDDGYGDDAAVEAEDQPVLSLNWVGASGKTWKIDFYAGDND